MYKSLINSSKALLRLRRILATFSGLHSLIRATTLQFGNAEHVFDTTIIII